MRSEIVLAAFCAAMLSGCAAVTSHPTAADLKRQVADTERAFAQTMADRNHAAFASFLADETVFFAGAKILRGKQQVAAAWKPFYDAKVAPFSWQPEVVEVLDSGNLAISTGPVRDPEGKVVATFTSIWRLEAPETWRIVFDKGNNVCDCAKP